MSGLEITGLALGTIAPFVSLIQNVESCIRTFERIKNAPDEVFEVIKELKGIKVVLLNVRDLVESLATDDTDADYISDLTGQSRQIFEVIDQCQRLATRSKASPLYFTLRRPQLIKNAQRLREVQQTLHLSLLLVNHSRIPQDERRINLLSSRVNQMQETLTETRNTILQTLESHLELGLNESRSKLERQAVLVWLDPFPFLERLQDLRALHVSGTSEWLLTHPAFMEWVQEPNKKLWCSGVGK
jgi:hypothetical protein